MRADVLDRFPRNPNASSTTDPGGEAAEPARACAPDTRPTENRNELELLAGAALERQIVDLPATALLRVEQLVIEHVQPEIDRLAQFWPTFVRIISGIAVSAMTMMTTR